MTTCNSSCSLPFAFAIVLALIPGLALPQTAQVPVAANEAVQPGGFVITNNVSDSCHRTSLYIYNVSSVAIKDNRVKSVVSNSTSDYGIYIGSDSSITQIRITGNTVAGNRTSGIVLNRTSGVIDGNQVFGNLGNGISMNGTASNISSDTLAFNTVTSNGGDGVELLSIVV